MMYPAVLQTVMNLDGFFGSLWRADSCGNNGSSSRTIRFPLLVYRVSINPGEWLEKLVGPTLTARWLESYW